MTFYPFVYVCTLVQSSMCDHIHIDDKVDAVLSICVTVYIIFVRELHCMYI